MPPFQDKEYLKKIHGALMSAYGPDGGYSKGNFNLSMDEFSQKMKDKDYASKIHGALDGAYGSNGGYSKGNFSLGFDDFYKKAVGDQSQQPAAQTGVKPPAQKPSFETRWEQGDKQPTIKNADGTSSTHKMMSWEADGKYYAAPTIVEKNGKLVELTQEQAIDHAYKTGDYREFGSDAEARGYAEGGYKKPKTAPIKVDPSLIRAYESTINEKAGLQAKNNNQVNEEFAKNNPIAAGQGYAFAGVGGYNPKQSNKPLTPENAQRKAQLEQEEKRLAELVIPKIDELTAAGVGAYTTKDGQVDYSKVYATAGQLSKNIGGGDVIKEVIAQKIIQKEQLNKLMPSIDAYVNEEFKKKTGKTIDQFYASKEGENKAVEKQAFAEKQYVQKQFADLQKKAEEDLTQKASEIFETYRPYLEVLGPNDKPEFDRLVKEYTTTVKGMAAKENARLKRIAKELEDQANAKLNKLAEKTGISQKDVDFINGLYNKAYAKAIEEEYQAGVLRQQGKMLLPGGAVKLGAKALYEGFTTALAGWGSGFVGLGLNNGFTDWMRSMQETADRNKTYDLPLKGSNLIDPSTYVTRLFRQLGMQAPALAMTFAFQNPIVGGLAGFATEGLQNVGEVYRNILDETGDPMAARAAAEKYLGKEVAMLPLHFAEASLFLKASTGVKGAIRSMVPEVAVENIQEFGQGYYQQIDSKNPKSFAKFVREDGPELFKETTLLTIMQQGAFGGAGQAYRALTERKSTGMAYLAELTRTKGLAHAGAAIDAMQLNGMIEETDGAVLKEFLGKMDADIEALRDAGVSDKQISGYVANAAEIEVLRNKEASLAMDSPLRQGYMKKRVELEKSLMDFAEGKGVSLMVTLPTGSTLSIPAGEAASVVEQLSPQIQNGAVQVEVVGSGQQANEIQKAVDAVPVAKPEEQVAEEEVVDVEPVTTVSEIIDQPIVYDGMRGRIYQDGQTLVFKKENAETEYEIGNVDELKDRSISDVGIAKQENVVGFDDSGNITVRGKSYVNNFSDPLMAINRDENGDIVSVNLETPDGKKRTFRGAEAEDIAYNIQLKKITENNAERQAFEDFINTDEEARSEVESGAVQEPATVDSAQADAQVQSEPATTEAELDKQLAEQVKAATKPELELQDMEDSDFDKLSSFEMEKKAKQRDRIMRDNERLQKLIDCIWS